MTRAAVERQLDNAVKYARVVLVLGLPRVGRTRVVTDWAKARDDVIFLSAAELTPDCGPVVAIDNLSVDVTAKVIADIRTSDEAKSLTRFVVIPSDLTAFTALRRALVGFVELVEVVPLQVDEYLSAQMPLAELVGPQGGIDPASEATNTGVPDFDRHWLCGGLPESLILDSLTASLAWRRAMITSLLARDYNAFQVTAASRLPEILAWIANQNGGEFDEESCQLLKKPELRSAIYVLEQLGLIRRLFNYPVGSNTSMSSKPKLFLRDSGLLHALRGVVTTDQLRNNDGAGDSWEGYATEAIIDACEGDAAFQFYRAEGPSGEDEIDLVLDFSIRGGPIWAIEFKLNPNEGARPGYFRASAVIGATGGFIVHSGATSRTDTTPQRLTLLAALERVRDLRKSLSQEGLENINVTKPPMIGVPATPGPNEGVTLSETRQQLPICYLA